MEKKKYPPLCRVFKIDPQGPMMASPETIKVDNTVTITNTTDCGWGKGQDFYGDEEDNDESNKPF